MRDVKVIKLEVMVIDLDGIGVEEVKEALENARYPNRCISPNVMGVKYCHVDWSDDHPLNKNDTHVEAYEILFK